MSEAKRYIVLPAYGFTDPVLGMGKLRTRAGVTRLDARSGLRESGAGGDAERLAAATTMTVLDAIRPDGPKLVEMTPQAELNLRAEVPGLKIVPIVTYRKMRAEQSVRRAARMEAVRGTRITVKVVDAASGAGLPGAKVVAFTDFRHQRGDEALTGQDGAVSLRIGEGARLDRLYVYGPARYWGYFAAGVDAERDSTVRITAINLDDPNLLLRRTFGVATEQAGAGVTVGIVDTGIAKHHPNLPNVTGGGNLVLAEVQANPAAMDEWGPAAEDGEHGTHVAGIVGARATPGRDLVGVAPGVALRSYRVFPNTGGDAMNYDIMKAIYRAVADGCDVINLSLGGGEPDEGVRTAIGFALDAGRLVVAAAGNDDRRPVSFPAALDACVAVSAMGRKSAFPSGSSETADVVKPYGTDPDGFFAAFSNYGPQIDLTGPGVGVVSTLPDDTFGVMSGTSMACPAIAGFAARLMAADPEIRNAAPAGRVAIWKAKLLGLGAPQGFGRDYEGSGLPLDAGA